MARRSAWSRTILGSPGRPSASSTCLMAASWKTRPSGINRLVCDWNGSHPMFLRTKYPEEEIENMPVLSKFYGIVIRMVFVRSLAAHFHAIYGQCELIVDRVEMRRQRPDENHANHNAIEF